MEYFNLRDDFIEPHYLPSLGESSYRSDFPFSDYLSLCLSNDIKFYFRLKKSSYFLILFLLMYLMIASTIKNTIFMGIVISIVPISCGFTILKARQRLNRIYRACLSKSKQNELLNFAEMGNEFQIKFYPNFLKNDYQTKGKDLYLHRYRNRQEELFWFSSPKFMFNVAHHSEIILITMFVICFPIFGHMWRENQFAFWLSTAAFIFHSLTSFMFTPGILVKNSMCSNIVLLRNGKIATEAINK